MTEILRVRARWSGFTGAPGYTVLHFAENFGTAGSEAVGTSAGAENAVSRTKAFFESVKLTLPSAVSVTVEGEVDVLDMLTGELVDSFSVTAPAASTGSNTGPFSAASGAVINWRTSGVRNGRRVRGRSFLVPLSSAIFTATGQIAAGHTTALAAAANTLADGTGLADLVVYGRPTPADKETGTPQLEDGIAFTVTSATVPTAGAILKSRRD